MLREYLRQMMPDAQAARCTARYDDALRVLAGIPCAADIRSLLVDGIGIVSRDAQSVDHSRHPVPADELSPHPDGGESFRMPGYGSAYPALSGAAAGRQSKAVARLCHGPRGRRFCQTYDEASGIPRSGDRDLWGRCDDFDPVVSLCKSPAAYCLPALVTSAGTWAGGSPSAESSGYVRKIDLVRRLSELASEAGYEPRPAGFGLSFIRQAHLTGSGSELWRKAAREWRMRGRLSEQVLMMSALAMRPAIHHRETATLLDDIWTLRGYYGDMGAGEIAAQVSGTAGAQAFAETAAAGEIECVWRRRTLANGIAICFWNLLRTASMNLECGSGREVMRVVSMDDRTAVRFLSLDTCVPFLIRPEMACRDMADSALSQVLGGTGDVADDVWSGEWANGLLVALGSSVPESGLWSIRPVLEDIDARYLECLTRRRYAPLAQMALCVPVWQALNGRHMLIERAALQGAGPCWAWPDELIKIAVSEIRDVAGSKSFKRSRQYSRELLDDATFTQLAEDPVCHALLDAERYDNGLMLRLLGYLFAECGCSTGQKCQLHDPRSLACSDAAGAYALICSRLGLGKPLMALNSWLSAVIFLKRRSTYRAMSYGVHAGKNSGPAL